LSRRSCRIESVLSKQTVRNGGCACSPARSEFGSMTPAPIPVVCAVLVDAHGRVLLAQRPAHKHLALKWEFPGGKVEPGETPEAALVREIAEELGCALVVGRALPRFTHDYGKTVIEMIPFVCALSPAGAVPEPREHLALAWVAPENLKTYDLAPADWPVVDCFATM
jgi:8-oxo-dGTP diphosphatase